MISFGAKVREAREKASIGLGEMENRTGMPWRYLMGIEDGEIFPSVETYRKIYEAMGVSYD